MESLLTTPSYYLIAGAIGLVGLILGIILGDLLDALELPFDGIDGWISSHAIFTALTVFGGTGVLLHQLISDTLVLLVALIACVVMFIVIAQLVRWLHKQQGDRPVSRESYYASLATVTAPIGAGGKLGEVETTNINGVRVRLSAYTSAENSLSVRTRVIIKRVETGRVFVIPLDNPSEEN